MSANTEGKMTTPYNEGFWCAVAGGRRSDNPYARGWSRIAALVMPGSLSDEWDKGFQEGRLFDQDIDATMAIIRRATNPKEQN